MKLSISALTFDCADATKLADFWSHVLGVPIDPDATEGFASIGQSASPPLDPGWMFIQVPEGKTAKNRFHIDFASEDWAADVEAVVALGAKRIGDYDESGARWVSLADPEGNEFDIVAGGH